MRKTNRSALFCSAVIAAGLLLLGTAVTVGRARNEKIRYIQSEREMARRDLCDAADDMLLALQAGDAAGLNRAAGRAEAYLSRSGLNDCGEIYRNINKISSGECGEEICARFVESVKKAVSGDEGEALREISGGEIPINDTDEEETTEDMFSARMLKQLGKSRDDVAFHRAQSFACPNAEFDECEIGIPSSFSYSGDNIFVLVSGENPRVVLYCFDRDTDTRYTITQDEAMWNAEMIIKREKLRLGEKREIEERNGIYRTVFFGKNELADLPMVNIEIYSDTGRLRLYDAEKYYENQK